jgi:hypothetical protein
VGEHVPLGVDDVTPEWLSSALGAPVQGLEILDRHSGTTGRARFAVSYARDRRARGQPASVFVKLAPFDERQRRFVDAVGLGVAEARFYDEIAPDAPVRVPRPYHAATDESGHYAMVLEDLVASGCRFPGLRDADLDGLVGRIVVELAKLHARYWMAAALGAELAWVTDGLRLAFGGGAPFISRALDRFADEMPPAFRRIGELYVAETPGIARLFEEAGPPTLAHGDPHLGNLFVDGVRPGFYDWGMVMQRAGMWDVAYVLCNGIPTDVRRAREHECIRAYLATLADAGVELDASTAWEQYRLFAAYAWSSATATAGVGTRWQPEEVGRGGMVTATAAVDDLDSIGLLEELLGS